MASRIRVQLIASLLSNANLAGFFTGKIYKGALKSICVPGLNCYSCPGALGACPVGAWQGVFSGFAPSFPFYVAGLLMTFALLFGRFICGWLCPFGFLQEIIYRIPVRKIKDRPWMIGRFRIFTFAAVIFGAMASYLLTGIGSPIFCEYFCPTGTFEAALPLFITVPGLFQSAGWITLLKFIILVIVFVVSALIFRPFCKFLCPLGYFYGFFNRFALFGIFVDNFRCVKCGKCSTVCKMGAKIAGDPNCISCGICEKVCPENAIRFRKILPNQLTD